MAIEQRIPDSQRGDAPSHLFWHRWLQVTIAVVVVYSAALVLIGRIAGRLFDILGFGMRDAGITPGSPAQQHVLLVYGVLGSVMIGWMATLWMIARGPLRRREPWAWLTITGVLLLWFVIDTTFSLAIGSLTHALFNLAFLMILAPQLIGMRPRRGAIDAVPTTTLGIDQ